MNIRLLLIAGALIAGSSPLPFSLHAQQAPAATEQTDSIEALISAAMEVSRSNNIQQSEAAFNKVLQHPLVTPQQRYKAYEELLRVYQLRKDWGRIETALLNILQYPELTQAQRLQATIDLGDALQQQRKTDPAIASWQEALNSQTLTNNERALLQIKLAGAQHTKRAFKEAETILRTTLELTHIETETRYNALVLLGRSILDQNQNQVNATAEAVLRQATYLQGIDGKARYDAVLLLGRALHRLQNPAGTFANPATNIYYDKWLDQMIEDYSKVLQLGDLTNLQQIELYQLVANVQLEKLNIDEANRLFEQAIALSDLSASELAIARLNYARALNRQRATDKAKALYDQILNTEGQNPAQKLDTQIIRSSFEKDAAARVAYLRQHEVPLHRIANAIVNEDANLYVELYQQVLDDEKSSDGLRWDAYRNLVKHLAMQQRIDESKALFQQRADAFYQQNNRNAYRAPFNDWVFARDVLNTSPEFKLWVGETLLQKEINDTDKWVMLQYVAEASLALKQYGKFKTATERLIAENTTLKRENRLKLLFQLALIQTQNNADATVKAIRAQIAKEELEPKAQVDSLLEASRIALSMGYDRSARRLYEERQSMIVQQERPSLPLTFIANGPKDITGFIQSDYFRDLSKRGILDRLYSGDLQLLMETDTASAGRTMTTADGQSISLATGDMAQAAKLQQAQQQAVQNQLTSFIATCDEDSVYLFFFIPADAERVQKIRNGTAGVGGFEITLAEGRDAPYSCLLVEPYPSNTTYDSFITQYNNRNYRIKRAADKTLKTDFQVLDNGIAVLISLPWNGFVKLPQNGDKWYLEPIHWENGNRTWGGSNSVHWRETQGELVFDNLTADNLTAIKRRLLNRAKVEYTKEKSARNNGYIEFWQDHQLGDQQFYAEVIKPLQEKYDAYALRVTPDMTDQEVNEVFDNAYDFFINTRFILSELRAQYLLQQLTSAH